MIDENLKEELKKFKIQVIENSKKRLKIKNANKTLELLHKKGDIFNIRKLVT
ncbi:hypothetical protein [Candidatus Karelsulcia muelleri]|uniref:hypothetical protein n=1 Tax=Candidatus Karelsulcia muelleri TaxID=336810 RepID=UPI0013A6617B|nr:hypothetical protein [Candidatus Karelsulcia muelleri]